MPRQPNDTPKLFYDDSLEKWMVEEYDGNIREATPE